MTIRASVISPYQKFYALDGITPLSGGSVAFYENETTDLLAIFSDSNLTIPQDNPYDLDAGGGIAGDVHFVGLATITTFDSGGGEVQSFDFVSCFDQSVPFDVWIASVVYNDEGGSTNIVQSPVNGLMYISIANDNLNHEPSVSPAWWEIWPSAFQGGSLSTALNFARATVASHATTADIWGALGNQINWTGTATTTIFPNAPQAGSSRTLICADACSFTAGANMLIDGVNSGDTVTCAANDQMLVQAVSTTQFKLSRTKYDGTTQNFGPAAAQAQMESATSNAVGVTPLSAKWSPSAAKAWLKCNGAGTSILSSHNISSITDVGAGALGVVLDIDFSSANYSIAASAAAAASTVNIGAQTAGTFDLNNYDLVTVAQTDPSFYHAQCFGDQA